MKELRGTEWYGEYATLTDEHNDYIQIEYKCNGTGCLYDYALFPGIDLIFMDFNCPDTFHEPIPNKNIIEIRHCQKGRVEFELNSVYTRSGQNSTPNSNATNLHSSQKRCCSFCISSSNASPTFQVQKSIFHQMTKPIQVTVILPLLLAISFSRNDDIHSSISGISNDLIGVIPTIGQ